MSNTINQQQDLLPAAFNFFEIDKDDIYYHYQDSDRKFYIEKKQYIKHQLNVDTDPDYSKLKVGYILNHCQYSKKYIRQCAASRGVKITTDLSKADFVICHSSIGNINKHVDSSPLYRSTLYYYGNIYIKGAVINDDYYRNYDHSYYSGAFNLEYLNVIYRSHEEDLTVIHCNKFCEMNNEITIDIVDQLDAMWNNRQYDLINELLLNLTVKDPVAKWYCYIKLWSYKYSNRASRDAKNWFEINKIDEFSGYNESELIARLHNENSLSKENFKFLEKKARIRVHIINAEIYKAKITLKEEYKKYL
tara:strand:+ start:2210 stop:3124 length:915 start_codon:yes stop_codon:yes gene_type:complete